MKTHWGEAEYQTHRETKHPHGLAVSGTGTRTISKCHNPHAHLTLCLTRSRGPCGAVPPASPVARINQAMNPNTSAPPHSETHTRTRHAPSLPSTSSAARGRAFTGTAAAWATIGQKNTRLSSAPTPLCAASTAECAALCCLHRGRPPTPWLRMPLPLTRRVAAMRQAATLITYERRHACSQSF